MQLTNCIPPRPLSPARPPQQQFGSERPTLGRIEPDDDPTNRPALTTAKSPQFIASANYFKNWRHLDLCPRSTSMTALCEEYRCRALIALSCKQWDCRYCAPIKIRKLAAQTRDARPNRLLTLTIDPSLWASPLDSFDGTRHSVPEMITRLRRKYGEIEYFRVTEITKKGWPHYHLLIRSDYLPHEQVQHVWQSLTGATIVDIRQVKNSFDSCNYLTKYLSKLHKIPWTARHLSVSHNFFQPDTRPPRTKLSFLESKRVAQHPSSLLAENHEGSRVLRMSAQLFLLDPPTDAELAAPKLDEPF